MQAPVSGSDGKPSQEKQVGGLIPFENNGKWQPFLGEMSLL